MRVDFVNPVLAFGMFVIDNDFSVARLSAYDIAGTLLESVVIPQVSEGGTSYFGIDARPLSSRISYFILDGNTGAALDSTFIDDLSFTTVPLPAGLPLILTALGALSVMSRQARIRSRSNG